MNDSLENISLEELNNLIQTKINFFGEMTTFLSKQEQVSYKNHSTLQWNGGIIGTISEIREEKRLKKIMNTPLYNNFSFYQIAFHIISCVGNMVSMQSLVQQKASAEDECFYGNVVRIINTTRDVIEAWYNYCPEAAEAGITIGDEKDVALLPTVEYMTKKNIKKLYLPEGLKITEDENGSTKGGCFGVFLVILIPIALTFLFL
jgi:hypothetical protein